MYSFPRKGFCPLITKWLSELTLSSASLVLRLDLCFEMGLDEQHNIRFRLQSSIGQG
jgi:hypothetical protein